MLDIGWINHTGSPAVGSGTGNAFSLLFYLRGPITVLCFDVTRDEFSEVHVRLGRCCNQEAWTRLKVLRFAGFFSSLFLWSLFSGSLWLSLLQDSCCTVYGAALLLCYMCKRGRIATEKSRPIESTSQWSMQGFVKKSVAAEKTLSCPSLCLLYLHRLVWFIQNIDVCWCFISTRPWECVWRNAARSPSNSPSGS